MRAKEFVAEAKIGPLSKVNQDATVGLHKFRDKEFSDRIYELNRVMMAAACNDGDGLAVLRHRRTPMCP